MSPGSRDRAPQGAVLFVHHVAYTVTTACTEFLSAGTHHCRTTLQAPSCQPFATTCFSTVEAVIFSCVDCQPCVSVQSAPAVALRCPGPTHQDLWTSSQILIWFSPRVLRALNCVHDCDVSAVREPSRIDVALSLSERARPCRAAPRMPRRPCYSHRSAGARTHRCRSL